MIKKGIYLSITTAVISGFSVFINGFAAKTFSDPYLFTTLKNIIVALLLSSVIIGAFSMGQIKKLKVRDWVILILIGLIGGSIPFLLFFKGLALSSSSVAAFLHKTLFIWATVGAFFWLKEKITWHHLLGFLALIIGLILLSPWQKITFGWGEILVLIATLFWSAEAVFIRYLQSRNLPTTYYLVPTSPLILSWGRMFFGSIFMMIYLGLIEKIGGISQLGTVQWWWLILTSIFLFGYVTTWYASLKQAPVVLAASILAFGFPITVVLNFIFVTQQISGNLVLGLLIIFLAVIFLIRPIRPISQI